MALSDEEVERQINQMKRFIGQEAREKADEIMVKAEEEFNIEKGRLLQTEKIKIDNYYDRKEKQVELQRKIQHSNLLNQARLAALKAKDDHLKRLLEEATSRLKEVTKDNARYQTMLKDLITQGLYQLLETAVTVRCRKQDVTLVQGVCGAASEAFKKDTGIKCVLTIDTTFLGPEVSGGVDLLTHGGKIKVTNTLESRLELLYSQMLPEFRTILFGNNPNRRFTE